ncbi:MAG: hypothetical protein HXS54_13805 [Theionarchaea archaeon]|nr:hypothetical protein [Theionarchaea archaeon]
MIHRLFLLFGFQSLYFPLEVEESASNHIMILSPEGTLFQHAGVSGFIFAFPPRMLISYMSAGVYLLLKKALKALKLIIPHLQQRIIQTGKREDQQ